MNSYLKTLINLIKSVILDTQPQPIPKDINIKELVMLAEYHSVENMLYPALKKLEGIPTDIMRIVEELYKHAIINDATQQYYLDIITEEFEKQKVPYCVMKGPVIKKLYPSTNLRKSSDLDIFVEDNETEHVYNIMNALGFKTISFDKANAHDQYKIDKQINIEIHRKLISRVCPWQSECQKISERLIQENSKNYAYRMTEEDYYLYMIAHMAKHMDKKGIGIKMILDVWIYLNHYKEVLDWNILQENLKKCNLNKFEANIKKLCEYWFENNKYNETVERMSQYVFDCGTFGSEQLFYDTKMAKKMSFIHHEYPRKILMYLSAFFLSYKYMKEKYVVLEKYPILLPLCWCHRGFITIVHNKEKLNEIEADYNRADIENGKKIIDLKKEIGL